MAAVLSIIITLLIVNIAVIFHELGHLRSAQRHGIHIHEFSIGMGKVIKQWKTKDDLIVSWKIFPVGGSVRPSGMTVEEVEEGNLDKSKTYIYASPFTRFRVTVAGIGNNLLLALLAELVLVMFYLNPQSLEDFTRVPVVMFWVIVALLGIFIKIIVVAPFNGFENMASIVTMPSNVNNTLNAADESGMPILVIICIIVMMVNISMALLNALPIYPFDGFFLSTSIADGARKSINDETYEPLTMQKLKLWVVSGYSFTVALMGYLIVRDLFRMLG